MCNLYSVTKSQAAIIEFTRALRDVSGNVPMMPAVFPDFTDPIVRNATDGVRELAKARWGMPTSQFALMESCKKRAAKLETKGAPVDFKQLLRMEPDGGTTNIRNVNSKHCKRWLGVENRCVVPLSSFRSSTRERVAIFGSPSMRNGPSRSLQACGCRNGPLCGRSKRASQGR